MIPVMCPRLPDLVALTPYLRRIDELGIYTNFGPLYSELTERLAAYFNVGYDQVALFANGTLALQAAIETVGEASDVWVSPSWTFVATAQAITSARRRVYFVDVDPVTWALPVSDRSLARGQVIVAPFGDRPRIVEWANVRTHKLFDAASCFDACQGIGGELDDKSMLMVSLHATKPLAAGEGAVLVGPSDWVKRAERWGNFGFSGSRVASGPGLNAKISEYHCAVGLASLDGWFDKRRQLQDLTKRIQVISESAGVESQPSVSAGFVTSTWSVLFSSATVVDQAIAVLSDHGIETRRWWPSGVANMPAFTTAARESLTVSHDLAERVLGLPFGMHLTSDDFKLLQRLLTRIGA